MRGEYAHFTELDQMNYGFNVYDDGNVLSIVTTSGNFPLPLHSLASL